MHFVGTTLVVVLLGMALFTRNAWWLAGALVFFQAEDGIRDLTVTGVQTCALPISIDNQGGTITVASTTGLTLNRANATYTNTGLITLTGGDLTITGASPTLTNAGTLTIGSGRILSLTGTLNANSSDEHTGERKLQSNLVGRLLVEHDNTNITLSGSGATLT